MSQKVIDKLIINSPFEEPKYYWAYLREKQEFEKKEGRRKAGYWKSSGVGKVSHDDPGEFVEIKLVNNIRPRVQDWEKNNYPNVSGITRKLLEHWHDKNVRNNQFFWCQLEAIKTAIWLTEASPADKQGIQIGSDGSEWQRQCLKLATGTGKTVVMGMLIAWQVLNKISNPTDTRFSKNILVIAPGITVKDRLQVLLPGDPDNVYNSFSLVPASMLEQLRSAKILVKNWHALAPINENGGPKVVKKGPESDEAFVRRILSEFGTSNDFLIINDEAHHCHRPKEDDEDIEEEDKNEEEKATIWVSGIDRIHKARKVLKAYDLTATPFKPGGRGGQSEKLFTWIVSDFGLNDAIESGLVKTPKVAVRDDSKMSKDDFKSKLFHIYPHVKEDLNRRADKEEGLPDLARNGLNILGTDWLADKENWDKTNLEVPPVLIVICNRIETAARVEYSLMQGFTTVSELADNNGLLRIDQDALDKVEAGDEDSNKSKKDLAQKQRDKFNTVGKKGKPGQDIRCVIGVNMLSEGWDARTVTHILGLRAFTSQLLCEQVIGRGLRRISYDINDEGFFEPEYVTVFGIPFTFLPIEESSGPPKEEKPKTKIEPIQERSSFEIKWPHVLRVEYKLSYFLELDWHELKSLTLSSMDCPTVVDIAPVIDNKPDLTQIEEIKLFKLAEEGRFKSVKLQVISQIRERLKGNWKGDAGSQISQLLQIVEQFIDSDKLITKVPKFEHAELLRKIVISLNMQKIVNHIATYIKGQSKEAPVPIFDYERPVRSTVTSETWFTSKPTQPVKKSQISHIVIDSGWEAIGIEFERDRIPGLISWVKNDHIGFEIFYMWEGCVRKYYPDFLLKFEDNNYMILEVKGKHREEDKPKWQAAEEWVKAVNSNGNFGHWEFKVLKNPTDVFDVVRKPGDKVKQKA